MTICLCSGLANSTTNTTTTVTGNVVPNSFQTILWYWERNTLYKVFQTVTALYHFRIARILFGFVINKLWVSRSTTSLVHWHTVSIWILFKHCLLAVC